MKLQERSWQLQSQQKQQNSPNREQSRDASSSCMVTLSPQLPMPQKARTSGPPRVQSSLTERGADVESRLWKSSTESRLKAPGAVVWLTVAPPAASSGDGPWDGAPEGPPPPRPHPPDSTGDPSSGSQRSQNHPPPPELCQSLSCHTHLTCVFAATRRCHTHTHAHALVIYSLCLQSICMLCDHRNLPGTGRARAELVCGGAEMSPAGISWGEAQASMDVKSRPNPVPPAEQRGVLLHLRTPGFRSVIRPHQRPDGHGRVEARAKCEETGRVADPGPVPVPDPVPVPVPVPVPARRRPAAPSRGCCRCTAVKRRVERVERADAAAAAAADSACGALVRQAPSTAALRAGKHSSSGAGTREGLGNRMLAHVTAKCSFKWTRGAGARIQ